jgi:hypothetical protein
VLNKLIEALKGLTLQDKCLAGVALAIIINPTVSLFAAALTLTYFIWKIGKEVIKD